MIKHPQFLYLGDRLYLMSVTRSHGEITAIAGPYQCVSEPGSSRDELMEGLLRALHQATHSHPILNIEDLPEAIRDQVSKSLDSAQPS